MTEAINLDVSTVEVLEKFADEIDVNVDYVASCLFQSRPPEERNPVTILLGQYARLKAKAIVARVGGQIRKALSIENKCDGIYARLPDWARW